MKRRQVMGAALAAMLTLTNGTSLILAEEFEDVTSNQTNSGNGEVKPSIGSDDSDQSGTQNKLPESLRNFDPTKASHDEVKQILSDLDIKYTVTTFESDQKPETTQAQSVGENFTFNIYKYSYVDSKGEPAGEASVYRLYNPNTGEHLYTVDQNEKNSLVRSGWNDEGIGWYAPESGQGVYRLYNPNARGGDHYYTQNLDEADALNRMGWKFDNGKKPIFWAGGSVPVYVAYNPNASSGSHNYTTDRTEQNTLMRAGWKYDEVAWNCIRAGEKAVTPAKPSMSGADVFRKIHKTVFASGAGAWSTELTVEEDGSFTGYYHDSNAVGGPNDSPVRYYCNFSGWFSTPEQIDQYTWKVNLITMNIKDAAGTSYWDNGVYCQATDEPYGMNSAGVFYIYLPGKPVNQIPEAARSWMYGVMGNVGSRLGSNDAVLYNVGGKMAFCTYDY